MGEPGGHVGMAGPIPVPPGCDRGLLDGVALLPYSFLTYMPVVPSRHTYLAGAGLSLIVAAGFVTLQEQAGKRRGWVAAITLLIVVHQCGYLWIRKQRQYIERAEPTEILVQSLRDRQGLVDVYCFPYASQAADLAVSLRIGPRVQLRVAGMGRPDVPGPGRSICVEQRSHGPQCVRSRSQRLTGG